MIGTIGQMLLHILIALGQSVDQRSRRVEVGDDIGLIVVEALLQFIQALLGAIRVLDGDLARNKKTDASPGCQSKHQQQPDVV